MATVYEKAAKGNKKAMLALYESNKQRVYYFSRILLEDDLKASKATVKVFNEIWKRLETEVPECDADFKALLMQRTAKYCCNEILKADANAFQVKKLPEPEQDKSHELDTEIFEGDSENGLSQLNSALSKLDSCRKYIFLMYAAGRLTVRRISRVTKIKESSLTMLLSTTETQLSNTLKRLSAKDSRTDIPTYNQTASIFENTEKSTKVPESIDAEIFNAIESIVKARKKKLPKKAIIISGISLLVVLAIIISAVRIKASSKDADDNTVTSSESKAEIENISYYADIDIADYGVITVALDADSAPKTVENFVNLANEGFYNGLTFHRIIEGFMMQGGDPSGDGTGGSEETVFGEFSANGFENNLSHTRGAISMARSDNYDSASSQFFIVHEDSTYLDGQYAVFGYVTEGMDIVDQICTEAQPTDDNGTIPSDKQPVINSITIYE